MGKNNMGKNNSEQKSYIVDEYRVAMDALKAVYPYVALLAYLYDSENDKVIAADIVRAFGDGDEKSRSIARGVVKAFLAQVKTSEELYALLIAQIFSAIRGISLGFKENAALDAAIIKQIAIRALGIEDC